jgi:predicted HAD superfamily phosphohydrolase YqeG
MGIRKIPYRRLRSIEQLDGSFPCCDGVILLDLDNTILDYARGKGDIVAAAATIRSLKSRFPACELLVTSNTRRLSPRISESVTAAGAIGLIAHCQKPWVNRINSSLGEKHAIAVVGDQTMTDGILAWRMNVPFYKLDGISRSEPLWPQLLRLVGSVAERFSIFKLEGN